MRFLLSIFVSILFLMSCSETKKEAPATDNCKKLFAEACKMDSILFTQLEIDTNSANEAILAFTDFAYNCQNDSLSPIFLIKTAQVARAINNLPQAKRVLEHCINTHPNFKELPAAIFLLAQLYDDNHYMNNEVEAKRLYERIIAEYPESEWAKSAKGAIEFIGKSDQEITKLILGRKE